MDFDLIVIGGGFTGVHAAWEMERRLPEARVLLLEAAPVLGGRARSVAAGEGCALDLGAHYFGADHRRVRALAERVAPGCVYSHLPCYGADPSSWIWLEGAWRAVRRSESYLDIQGLSRRVSWEHRARIFESLLRYLELEARVDVAAPWRTPGAAALDAMTVADWIAAQRLPRWIHEMWTLAVLNVQSIWPEQISLLYWLWYNASNGGFIKIADDFAGGPQEFAVSCGMQGLVERHAEELRGPVRLGAPVRHIDHGRPGQVAVTLADGERLAARRVVVAVTPAAAGRLAYAPGLSEARSLLHTQPLGHAAKVVLRYATPWWRDTHGRHINVWSAGAAAYEIEWFLDTSHPDGRQHSLSGFVSDRLLDRAGPDPAARRAAVMAATVALCGDPRAAEALQVEVWDWRDQPWVGGGPNTAFAPGLLTRVGPAFHAAEGPEGRLHFAAAEYADEFTGYVEGALASAEQVAARVAHELAGDLGRPRGEAPASPRPRRPLKQPLRRLGLRLLCAAGMPVRWAADAARAVRGAEATL